MFSVRLSARVSYGNRFLVKSVKRIFVRCASRNGLKSIRDNVHCVAAPLPNGIARNSSRDSWLNCRSFASTAKMVARRWVLLWVFDRKSSLNLVGCPLWSFGKARTEMWISVWEMSCLREGHVAQRPSTTSMWMQFGGNTTWKSSVVSSRNADDIAPVEYAHRDGRSSTTATQTRYVSIPHRVVLPWMSFFTVCRWIDPVIDTGWHHSKP